MSMSQENDYHCRVFVGNLPRDVRPKVIKDLFYPFGKVTSVDLKNGKGPTYAFVEFEDYRDAEDAVYKMDRYDYDGWRLRVEFPRGTRTAEQWERGRGRGRGRARFGSGQRLKNKNRVVVSGLPSGTSWQDLKDHMKEAGPVCYADVFKDGTGVVEFLRYDDMQYALQKMDDSMLRSHEGDLARIRIKQEHMGMRRSSSRDKDGRPRYRRSRSKSSSVSSSPSPNRRAPTLTPGGSRSRSRPCSKQRR